MKCLTTTDCRSSIYHDSLSIRQLVFIKEQQIEPSIELDSLDPDCLHVVIYDDDQPVATARILPIAKKSWKIQRVAVKKSYRGKQLGRQLLENIILLAKSNGITCLVLHAQESSIEFYRKIGFKTYGELFFEATIPHIKMKYLLN